MDGAEDQNHYQVLGIDRTADARAVKKAYFALVRKFTPEKNPDEFQRIRAAYEVLSDPVQRERYDAAEKGFGEYDETVATRLRAIEEATRTSDDAMVHDMLRALLRDHPNVTVARENLALSLLRTGDAAGAYAELEHLVEAAPENARYAFHRGIALARLDRKGDAERSLERAILLDPAFVPARVALSDLLIDERKVDEGIRVLDEALPTLDRTTPNYFVVAMRKVDALYIRDRAGQAQKMVTELLAEVGSDPDQRKYVSSQLAAVAAKLFARKEPDLANALLERCGEVNADSPVELPYPAVATLRVDELPEEGRAWLGRLAPGPQSATLAQAVWTMPVVAFVLGIAATWAAVLGLSSLPVPWSAATLALAFAAVALALAPLAWSLRASLRILKSPLRGLLTVHPLYLVKVDCDEVRVYSLFHLTDIHPVHHHTNGVYTHTAIKFVFGPKTSLQISIRDRSYAEGWLSFFFSTRGRSLELMAEGYLEAEHGVELLPPRLVLSAKDRKRELGWLRPWGAALALASAVTTAGLYVSASRAGDAEAWAHAVSAGSAASYATYLRERPRGRYAADAERLLGATFDRGVARLRARATAGDGERALEQALAIARASRRVGLPVRLAGAAGDAQDLPALVTALGAPFRAVGLGELLLPRAAASDDVGLALVVEPKPRGDRVVWSVRLTRGEGAVLRESEVETEASRAPAGAALPASVVDDLARGIARGFGLPEPPTSAAKPRPATRSPYRP